ncbi:MAG: LacI family DNA-binding transcriptional regulator [Bacilli bacterium]
MNNKKVTIYDVAKRADVSLATVSRVINNSPSVKELTRERVKQAIEDLNFVPSAVAQGLALNKTTNIALIVPEASQSYVSKVISGVVDVAHIYNYNIILHTTNFGQFEVNKIIEKIVKNRMDGVIILNSELKTETIERLVRYSIPITVIGNKIVGPRKTSVYIDYETCMYDLVLDYLQRGITKIKFIDGDYNLEHTSQMINGIKKAYASQNLVFDGVIRVDESYQFSYDALVNYFKENQDDQLVIGARDSLAIAGMNAAIDCGIEVPKQMEFIGVNGSKYARMARPSLSSITIPLYELGAIAARQMTKLLAEESIDEPCYEVHSTYVQRGSTK